MPPTHRYPPGGLPRRGGFTFIELIVALAIISMIAAAVTPVLFSSLDRARVTTAVAALTGISDAIDVLEDEAPTVRIGKPGRDTKVSSLEEVFTEAQASDDYGVAKLELVYSVNGGAQQTIPLHASGKRGLKEISAGHTFFIEEMNGNDVKGYVTPIGGILTGNGPAPDGVFPIAIVLVK